jgi:hypothetical protein
MSRDPKDIAAEALELPAAARAELASQLLESLDDLSDEGRNIEAVGADEVFARRFGRSIHSRPANDDRVYQRTAAIGKAAFKYNVISVIDDTEVVVVAIAHYRRRPDYWHGRLAAVR